ncbi:MAG: sigma-70 family RNA polymerase sigma factor [Bacteroidota bacterium]
MGSESENSKEKRFRQVVADNRDRIFRICLAYLHDRAEADDLYQEVLIRIWQNLETFRGESQIGTWVYRVAVNTALMHTRKEKRRKGFFTRSKTGDHANIPAEPPVDYAEQDAQITLLRTCMQQLPDQDRIITSMLLDGLAYKEIAEIMGITVSLVGVRINRIKKKLAKQMKLASHGV